MVVSGVYEPVMEKDQRDDRPAAHVMGEMRKDTQPTLCTSLFCSKDLTDCFSFCRTNWKRKILSDFALGSPCGQGVHIGRGVIPLWRRCPAGQQEWTLPRLLTSGVYLQGVHLFGPLHVCKEGGTPFAPDPNEGPPRRFLPHEGRTLLGHRELPRLCCAAGATRPGVRECVPSRVPKSCTLRQLLRSLQDLKHLGGLGGRVGEGGVVYLCAV